MGRYLGYNLGMKDNLTSKGELIMSKIIEVKVKNVYGIDRIYPMTFSNELEALTGTKTLSAEHIAALKKLGFEFKPVSEVI